jgi:DNA-binding NtrC family response regulator
MLMTDLSQQCIMVVDQNASAGAILAKALTRADYRVAGPFNECSDASHWLASGTPDGALLDMLLTEEMCFVLAKQLRSLGVPFLFHSGWGQVDSGSDVARSKPGPPLNALLSAMSELIRRGSDGSGE